MGAEHGLCQTAGFEQGKAQQDGVAHAGPDRHDTGIPGHYGIKDAHPDWLSQPYQRS